MFLLYTKYPIHVSLINMQNNRFIRNMRYRVFMSQDKYFTSSFIQRSKLVLKSHIFRIIMSFRSCSTQILIKFISFLILTDLPISRLSKTPSPAPSHGKCSIFIQFNLKNLDFYKLFYLSSNDSHDLKSKIYYMLIEIQKFRSKFCIFF